MPHAALLLAKRIPSLWSSPSSSSSNEPLRSSPKKNLSHRSFFLPENSNQKHPRTTLSHSFPFSSSLLTTKSAPSPQKHALFFLASLPQLSSSKEMNSPLTFSLPPPSILPLPPKISPTACSPKMLLPAAASAPQQPAAFADSFLPGVNLWLAFKNTVLIPW